MAQDTPHKLVFAGTVLENQSASRMPKLMHGDVNSTVFVNAMDMPRIGDRRSAADHSRYGE